MSTTQEDDLNFKETDDSEDEGTLSDDGADGDCNSAEAVMLPQPKRRPKQPGTPPPRHMLSQNPRRKARTGVKRAAESDQKAPSRATKVKLETEGTVAKGKHVPRIIVNSVPLAPGPLIPGPQANVQNQNQKLDGVPEARGGGVPEPLGSPPKGGSNSPSSSTGKGRKGAIYSGKGYTQRVPIPSQAPAAPVAAVAPAAQVAAIPPVPQEHQVDETPAAPVAPIPPAAAPPVPPWTQARTLQVFQTVEEMLLRQELF